MKSKPIFSMFQTMKLRLSDFRIFTVWDYFFFFFFFFFFSSDRVKNPAKGFTCIILVWNCVKRLTFRPQTAVTYCADVTRLLHVTSGGLYASQADYHLLKHFLCVDFLRCIALNFYLALFSTFKTALFFLLFFFFFVVVVVLLLLFFIVVVVYFVLFCPIPCP